MTSKSIEFDPHRSRETAKLVSFTGKGLALNKPLNLAQHAQLEIKALSVVILLVRLFIYRATLTQRVLLLCDALRQNH